MPTDRTLIPLGYAWLALEYGLNPIPHYVESYTTDSGTRMTELPNLASGHGGPHSCKDGQGEIRDQKSGLLRFARAAGIRFQKRE